MRNSQAVDLSGAAHPLADGIQPQCDQNLGVNGWSLGVSIKDPAWFITPQNEVISTLTILEKPSSNGRLMLAERWVEQVPLLANDPRSVFG
jgi:hypothetical protein